MAFPYNQNFANSAYFQLLSLLSYYERKVHTLYIYQLYYVSALYNNSYKVQGNESLFHYDQ